MFDKFATWLPLLRTIVIVVALATSSPGRAQEIVVTVYGEPITTLDIEQRTKFTEMATSKIPSRQQVIDELTKEKLKVREAKKHGLNLSNEEVDLVYENFARRLQELPAFPSIRIIYEPHLTTRRHRPRALTAPLGHPTRRFN